MHELRCRTLRDAPQRFFKTFLCVLCAPVVVGTEEGCSGLRGGKSPGFPPPKVFIARKEDVIGVLLLSQPADDAPNCAFRHYRASCRGAIRAPLDVKENSAAGTGHGRVGIVANFDEPAMRRIVQAHLLLLKPRRRIFWINYHVLVVVRQGRVIDPCIRLRNCVKWIFCALRQRRIIGVDLADLENARRCALVAFGFLRTGFVCAEHTSSPGQARFFHRGPERAQRLHASWRHLARRVEVCRRSRPSRQRQRQPAV